MSGAPAVLATYGPVDPTAPTVVLLHGRGSNEGEIIELATHLPAGLHYVALRAPIVEGSGYAWFANRGIGRPLAESLAESLAWFDAWCQDYAGTSRRVVVGFSGGAAFAGALVLSQPERYDAAAVLYGTLPFDAGLATSAHRLDGVEVLVIHGERDQVIPRDLLDRTWSYLHNESGATLRARQSPGGHEIAADDVVVLSDWLTSLVEARRS